MEQLFLHPGFVVIPRTPAILLAVVGSGIIVSIYDVKKEYGGMAYFAKADSSDKNRKTPMFAKPAIYSLFNLFLERGSQIENMEAHFYGGASNENVKTYKNGIAEQNIKMAKRVLEEKGILITGMDIAGKLGRKIVFNSATGEIVIAKINNIREKDWYPEIV